MRSLAIAALVLLAGCALAPDRSPVADWEASANHNPRTPRLIVIHHTETASAEEAMAILRRSSGENRVSSHYLIGREGHTWQLVREGDRAWHAGKSRWAGFDDLNSWSVGIEMENDGVSAYPPEQIDALLVLLEDICYRDKIDRSQVFGHGDVALGRKTDPSAAFPWATLAAHGFGIWPHAERAAAPAGFDPLVALRLIGYDISDTAPAIRAFKRHFRGIQWSNVLDDDDRAILYDLYLQLLTPAAPLPIDAPL